MANLHVVARSRMVGLRIYLHSPIRPHRVVFPWHRDTLAFYSVGNHILFWTGSNWVLKCPRITGNQLLQGLKSHIYGQEVYYFVSFEASESMQCPVRSAHDCEGTTQGMDNTRGNCQHVRPSLTDDIGAVNGRGNRSQSYKQTDTSLTQRCDTNNSVW
jgi:hypothetical protein